MDYFEFLNRIIDEGIQAATADYTRESEKLHLEGSIAGFEACRNKSPEELVEIWKNAQNDVDQAFFNNNERYWWYRCFQLEVEWVMNVVSAMLVNEGRPPLLSWLPTVRGFMKAASIVGVKKEDFLN